MYQKEFEQILQKRLPKALLAYGENQYALEGYISKYITELDVKEDLLKLYFDEYNFEQAKTYLAQNSLFGGINLLIIKHDKAIPKKELETLLELVKKNSDNYLLYLFYGVQKDIKSNAALFRSDDAIEVRLFEPSVRESITILQKKANELQIQIDPYALEHLIMVLNNNLMLCSNELEKLSTLSRPISSKDIDDLVYSDAPLGVEKLLMDLCNKKPISNTINTLLELGEDAVYLLRSTQMFMNQILLFQAYIKINGNVNSAEILGYKLPKQIEEQKAALASRIKSSSLLKILEHLLRSELEIKSAPAPQKETLLYGMFIKLQSYL
ncbi:MAG: DNA polymerase III subunit delta [Sulfurovaceae bacterium]|nr:DNA polymerase III subunit delta [Sulfurovaceae bacterium]